MVNNGWSCSGAFHIYMNSNIDFHMATYCSRASK